MTSRGKNAVRGFETEIERSREEANWKKAVELAQQLKARSTQHESLAHFLIGEGKLEEYLEQWPPTKENIPRAQAELTEARGYLTLASDETGKKAGVALDAHLLLGKLNYACGDYDDALKHYKLAELDTLTEKELPVRSLRIVAESYAIKGLCLELTAPTSATRYKHAEREAEMVRNVEVSSELALVYLQRCGGAARAGHTLETALQRAALLHVRAHRLTHALDRYREMLRAVEAPPTQSLRLTLARQLAELLLRGVTGQVYRPPCLDRGGGGGGTLPRKTDEGPWKPRKYTGINQFVPTNEYEEILLAVMVGEAMGVRSAVLSQSAEFRAAREHAAGGARALRDLLALGAARWGLRGVLIESLERAMKFSYGESHAWRQRALACAGAAPHRAPLPHHIADLQPRPGSAAWHQCMRAARVNERATALVKDAPLRLLAADNYYHMGWLEEGILESEAGLRIAEKEDDEVMTARCCLQAGIGYQMLAQKCRTRRERERTRAQSEGYLLRAAREDNNNSLTFYHLALHHVAKGELNEAMEATRVCLECEFSSVGGLQLCLALWRAGGPSGGPAGGRGGAGAAAAALAEHEHPRAVWRLAAGEMSLEAGKELLGVVYEGEAECEQRYVELDTTSLAREDALSTRDTVSVRGESVRSGAETAATGVTGVTGAGPGAGPGVGPGAGRARAWLMLADVCLRLGRVSAAAGCVSEAAALTPFDHLVLYTRGRVHAALGEWGAAVASFQDALAVHPTHTDSMAQLGAAYFQQGWVGLAETWVRAACSSAGGGAGAVGGGASVLVGGANGLGGGAGAGAGAAPWAALGGVLLARGDAAQAADAAAAALMIITKQNPNP